MNKTEIISAWAIIRETNNDIPDDVLDFMKNAAVEKLETEKPSMEIYMPPYFEDDQECGYCQREIGGSHKNSCRQWG